MARCDTKFVFCTNECIKLMIKHSRAGFVDQSISSKIIEANIRQAKPIVGNVMCHLVVFIDKFTICQCYWLNWTKLANKLPNISKYKLNDTYQPMLHLLGIW